jgi:cadmium resistance protein CadD (predicted permease)
VRRSESALTVALGVVIAVPVLSLIALYGAFAGGYVPAKIWAWYLLPLGLGLPALGWKHFWAIGATVRLCFGSRTSKKKDDERDQTEKLTAAALAIVGPWLVLGFAWWPKS